MHTKKARLIRAFFVSKFDGNLTYVQYLTYSLLFC